MKERRARGKAYAINLAGGSCKKCGGEDNLNFTEGTLGNVSSSFGYSKTLIKKYLKGAELRCRACLDWKPPMKGKKMTERQKKLLNTEGLLIGQQRGSKNPQWKGKQVGYFGLHLWLKKTLGKPRKCEDCGEERRCVWANISGEYKRETGDFKSLCYRCHYYFDINRYGSARRYYGKEAK